MVNDLGAIDSFSGAGDLVERLPVVYDAPGWLQPYVERTNLEILKDGPRDEKGRRKSVVKTRQGRGGPVQYVGWTDVADLFDDVWGPGGWSISIKKLMENVRVDKGAPGEFIKEQSVWCVFEAPGLFRPIEVFGWGDYYTKDQSAHVTDAIEAAMSRALTKAGARLSKVLRSVWGKNDSDMQAVLPASPAQVSGVKMMINQLEKAGHKNKVDELLNKYKLDSEGLGKTTAAELTDIGKELAKLFSEVMTE